MEEELGGSAKLLIEKGARVNARDRYNVPLCAYMYTHTHTHTHTHCMMDTNVLVELLKL